MNKKAFSFVELIVVVTIVILLWVVANTIHSNHKTKVFNSRNLFDLELLDNTFEEYIVETNSLPNPDGNTNWFAEDTSYVEKGASDAYGVYGQLTNNTLSNKYLTFLPIDQFTGAFFAYGKLVWSHEFEIAWVVREEGRAKTIVKGNYVARKWPYNLIREYNWPNFVSDESYNYFPYNPEELVLNARVSELSFSGAYSVGQVFTQWDEISVPANQTLTLYFADGSKSVLGDPSSETKLVLNEMVYPKDNSITSKITLVLNSGTIWANATQMSDESELNILVWDTTAAVRGTIFWVRNSSNTMQVDVVSGKVEKTDKHGHTTEITTATHNIPSLDNKIKQWIWELIPSLKTQIVRYIHSTHTVTLKISDAIRYDADYLKVLNSPRPANSNEPYSKKYELPQDLDSDNNGEHDFIIEDTSLPATIKLMFCKQENDQEICIRDAGTTTLLSYEYNPITRMSHPIFADVPPWTKLSELDTNNEVDLSGEFTISIKLNRIPTIGHWGAKQYVLYKSNGNQDLKLYFANASFTWNQDKLCIQKEWSTNWSSQCIAPSKDITLIRDNQGNLTLNGQATGLNILGDLGGDLTLWNNVGFLPLSQKIKTILFE